MFEFTGSVKVGSGYSKKNRDALNMACNGVCGQPNYPHPVTSTDSSTVKGSTGERLGRFLREHALLAPRSGDASILYRAPCSSGPAEVRTNSDSFCRILFLEVVPGRVDDAGGVPHPDLPAPA